MRSEQNAADKFINNRTTRRKNIATNPKLLPNVKQHLQLPPQANPIRGLLLPHILRRRERNVLAVNEHHRRELQLFKERGERCNPRVGTSRIRPKNRIISNPQQRSVPPDEQSLHNPRVAEFKRSRVMTARQPSTHLARVAPLSPLCARPRNARAAGRENTRPAPETRNVARISAKFGKLRITKTTALRAPKV